MTVNLKATFKKDQKEYNGLDEEQTRKGLIEEPLARRYVVAMIETSKVVKDIEAGGTLVPTVRIISIEVLDGDDAIVAKEMLDKKFKVRTGRDVQPSLFDQDDPDAVRDASEHTPEAVGEILAGGVPFLAPPESDQGPDTEPPADEPPADDKPKRGRK